jgi:hypothetical protein
MNSTRSIGTIPISFDTLEPLLYVQALPAQLFWYLSTRMGLTLCSFQHAPMGCNVHVTTRGWIQLAVLNYPHFFETLSRYCTYRLFQLQLFWYLSTRMGPNPLFPFQHAPMGCNVHVTTHYGWIQLALVELSPLLWDIGPLLYVQALPAPTIFGIFQLGWANPFVPFQHAPMGCNVHVTTRGWIQLALVRLSHFFDTLEPLLYVQALPV